jgi:hypothetical protein
MPRQPTSVLGGRTVVPGGRRFQVAAITASILLVEAVTATIETRVDPRPFAGGDARAEPQSAALVEEHPEPG